MTNRKETGNFAENVEGNEKGAARPNHHMSPTTISTSTTHNHTTGWWAGHIAWGLVASILFSFLSLLVYYNFFNNFFFFVFVVEIK